MPLQVIGELYQPPPSWTPIVLDPRASIGVTSYVWYSTRLWKSVQPGARSPLGETGLPLRNAWYAPSAVMLSRAERTAEGTEKSLRKREASVAMRSGPGMGVLRSAPIPSGMERGPTSAAGCHAAVSPA